MTITSRGIEMRKLACSAVLLWSALGCVETDGNTSGLLAPPNTVLEPETALAIWGTRTIGGTPTTGALSAVDLENAIYSICQAQVEAALPIFCPNSGALDVGGCSGHQCMMQINYCAGAKYLEIAQEVRELAFTTPLLGGSYQTGYTLPAGTSVTYEIPPQSAPNRTLAYDLAVTAFARGGERAVSAIDSTSPNCFTTSGGINSTVTQSDIRNNRAKVFATTFADTTQSYVEATEGFTRSSLQVAGHQRQRERDFGEASQFLWNGRVNSVRSVAAALGSRDDGTDITLATCLPNVRNKVSLQGAVSLMRRAALSETLGATTTENFLTSIRNQFESMSPELDYGAMTNDEFLDHFDLSRADVADGRQYLQEEDAAFQRTSLETYSGSGRIAGIATEPQALPAGAALAKTAGARVLAGVGISQSTYRGSGILQMLDYFRWGVRRAYRISALPVDIQPTFRAIQAIAEAETGVRRVSVTSNSGTSVKVNVHNASSADKYVVVAGIDGARCLSEGTIEGAPCNPSSYILDDTASFVAGDPSFVHELQGTLTYIATVTGGSEIYLLSADGPWKVLAGLNVTGIPGTTNAIVLPIGGLVQESLAQAVAPHPEECGETANDCVGLPADLVVPLESELTEDNDPYENSWRHYLDLADQMAQEADALGEELIAAGLANDQRQEAARDELEALCGGVQNVDTIYDAAGGYDESLDACLPGGALTQKLPWVTLGDHAFCVLADNPDPTCEASCRAPVDENDECDVGYEYVRPLGLVTTEEPPSIADCQPLAELITAGALTGKARAEVVADLLQGRGRWAKRRELAQVMEHALYDESYPYGLEISIGGTALLRLGDDSTPPHLDPTGDTDQNTALRTVAPELFNQLQSPNTSQRKAYIQHARRAFGTLGLLAGSLRSNMRRSWVAPGNYDCEEDDDLPERGQCTRLEDGELEYQVASCDVVGGCRCLLDNVPAPPWDYGTVPCDEGARFDYIVDFGIQDDVDSAEPWNDLWSAGGGIDCESEELPSLEDVLCALPRGDRFGYPWDELFEFDQALPHDPDGPGPFPAQNPEATRRGLGFLGQPADILAPTADEASPLADAETVSDFDIYQALALACFMQQNSNAGCPAFDPANPPDPPDVSNAGDLRLVEERVSCAAKAVRSSVSTVLLANIPEAVVEAIGSPNPQSLYPHFRGEHLDALNAVKTDLQEIARFAGNLEAQLVRAKLATQLARESLRANGLQQEIQELQTISNILSAASDAAAGALTSFGASTVLTGAQLVLTAEISELEDELLQVRASQVLTEYTSQVGDILAAITSVGSDLHEAVYRLNSDLAHIESIQNRAASAAARAAFLDESAAGQLFPVTTVMRRRYNTLRIRYERARDRARQMAFVARRAIEQRFGLNLSQMNEDMTLVEAPATWARDVCTFEGIDYDRIREAPPEGVEVPDNYVEGYLGEYVDKLRLFVESYPFDFPFQDGADLAVISLRDDILRAHKECEVPVPNLLASSESVVGVIGEEESIPAWYVEGCSDINPDGTPESCVYLETKSLAALPGRSGNRIADANVEMADTTGVVVQEIEVSRPGRLLLSWQDAFLTPDGNVIESVGVAARTEYDVTLSRVGTSETATAAFTPALAGALSARTLVLDVHDAGTVRLEIDPSNDTDVHGDVWLWELQLELLDSEREAEVSPAKSDYAPTTESGLSRLAVCPDFDGGVLREEFFDYQCGHLCTGGVDEGCGDRDERVQGEACFYETAFGIGLDQIERGEIIPSGAIALGNYNYRHDLVAVNLVGTNVRDCTRSAEPATCYSNAFIPVSLIHAGEARIRNHTGDDVSFDFGRGNIEHGKALASEVVLTNPLSGSAETLLQSYYKQELRGRPLTGQYWLRVWDDQALNWENVEDIQLVFRYRYWTRFGQ